MNRHIQALDPADFAEVRDFYWDLIDQFVGLQYHPAWERGVYPSDEFLRESLATGNLYGLREERTLMGAMVLNHDGNEGYRRCSRQVEAPAEEVLVIHALGVLPSHHQRGLAKELVREAVTLARAEGDKAVRLDVLAGNVPAQRLYEGQGFLRRAETRMFYEDTGWTDFLLYELLL